MATDRLLERTAEPIGTPPRTERGRGHGVSNVDIGQGDPQTTSAIDHRSLIDFAAVARSLRREVRTANPEYADRLRVRNACAR
jgi:hypothetical protein